MPRGRPKKQLQAIQEDEVLDDIEEQEETAPAIDEEKLKVIQQLEAEGETGRASQLTANDVHDFVYSKMPQIVNTAAVQERAAALLAMAEAECRSILHDFTVQLMKLPKQVGCACLQYAQAQHAAMPDVLSPLRSMRTIQCMLDCHLTRHAMNRCVKCRWESSQASMVEMLTPCSWTTSTSACKQQRWLAFINTSSHPIVKPLRRQCSQSLLTIRDTCALIFERVEDLQEAAVTEMC